MPASVTAPTDGRPQLAGFERDTNVVVAANLRAIRAERGLTQAQVADRLGELVGRRVCPVSISQMESGGYASGRRRRFDAHDLVLLSELFDVPVVYFFLPQPGDQDIEKRLRGLLGPTDDVAAIDNRLADLASTPSDRAVGIIAHLMGGVPLDHSRVADHYRTWRRRRLAAIETAAQDDADQVADVLGNLAAAIKQSGPRGFLRHLDRNQ